MDSSGPVRVAVASDDGQTIQQHFGRVSCFRVYEIDGAQVRLIEVRDNEPACHSGRHEHFDAYLAETVELVSDCRVVLAARVGAVAQAHLARRNVVCLQVTGRIDTVLEQLARNIGRLAIRRQEDAAATQGKGS